MPALLTLCAGDACAMEKFFPDERNRPCSVFCRSVTSRHASWGTDAPPMSREAHSIAKCNKEPRGEPPEGGSRSGSPARMLASAVAHSPTHRRQPDSSPLRFVAAASNRSRKSCYVLCPLGRVLFWELFLCRKRTPMTYSFDPQLNNS